MGRFARQLSEIYQQIRSSPYALCKALRFEPTWQQRQLFDAVIAAENRTGSPYIACKSGQGPGKTTASAVVGLYRTLRAEDALTILTAPTMRQCNEVWLAELRRLLKKADPWLQHVVNVTKTKVEIAGRADWGIKTVTATKEENAQGYHEPNMTIICEEASGISRPIVEQFKGTASNPNCLFLMIGNPNTRECAFFDCFHSQRHMWHVMTWNAEETPTSEWFDPIRNTRLADEFGADSDIYRVRVKGEFPFSDPNCVMSSEDVEKCQDREALLLQCVKMLRDGKTVRQIGLDFARFGSDESTIYRRSGNAIVEWARFAHTDPSVVVDRAFRMQADSQWRTEDTEYVADAGGMGQGIMHKFHNAHKRIHEFHNGGKAVRSAEFENKITEAFFNLGRLVRERRCYIPKDNILTQQLCSRQYFTNIKGKLVLESKDEYMKRGYESPDRADGCVLAFWDHATVGAQIAVRGESPRRLTAWGDQ